ncbi:18000_t:CDS:1, partial [Racocetra persica]
DTSLRSTAKKKRQYTLHGTFLYRKLQIGTGKRKYTFHWTFLYRKRRTGKKKVYISRDVLLSKPTNWIEESVHFTERSFIENYELDS